MSGAEQESMRAGNEDREQVVAQLNTAFAEGRLDVGELDERVAAAYRAKTLGELVPLTADLPVPHRRPSGRPAAAGPPARRQEVARPSGSARWAPVGGMAGVFLLNVLIWGVVSVTSGHTVYFWPAWIAIPFVLALISVISGSGRRDRR